MGFIWHAIKNSALDSIPIYGTIRKVRRMKADYNRERDAQIMRQAAAIQARAQNSDTIPAAALAGRRRRRRRR